MFFLCVQLCCLNFKPALYVYNSNYSNQMSCSQSYQAAITVPQLFRNFRHNCHGCFFEYFELNHFNAHSTICNPFQDEKLYFVKDLSIGDIIQQLNKADGPCQNFQLRKGQSYRWSNKTVMVHTLICQRGRMFTEQSTKSENKKQRRTTTSFPLTQDERCKFQIKIYHDMKSNRFFLRRSSGSCWHHNDHPPISRDLQEDRLRNIPEESLQVASELLRQLVPPSMVQKYINADTGLSPSSSSLEYLRNLVLTDKHGTSTDESLAQKLINMLDNTEGVSYVTLTG
jgi:hypothetical protein